MKYQILFVDDDEVIGFIISKYSFWKNSEFQLKKIVENGTEALKALEREAFDLVITDIRMPVMDGLELVRKIRESPMELPVILSSTYSDFKYAKEGIRLGALDYIEKPFTEEKLIEALKFVKEYWSQKKEQEISKEIIQEAKVSQPVRKLIGLMKKYYKEEQCLEFVAQEMELSKDYIGRILKKEIGMTPLEYITSLRIEEAKYLLKNSQMKVYEIAQELGYSTVDYFTKLFKKHMNMTPAAYRKQ